MPSPDWTHFSTAYLSGLPRAGFLRSLVKGESWLDLPVSAALAALQNEPAESRRTFFQCFSVLRLKLQREFGLPIDVDCEARLETLFAAAEKGHGSEEDLQLAARMSVAGQLSAALLKSDPTLGQPLPTAEEAKLELMRATTVIFDRLSRQPGNAPGSVTPESIQELASILEDYHDLVRKSSPDNAALPNVYYGMAHTALSLAKSCATIGRNPEASGYFEQAAEYFTQAAEPEKAEACRAELRHFEQRLSAAFDAAAAENLEALVDTAKSVDPIARIESLMNLANVAADAFDVFDALNNAEAAVLELEELHYSDPQKVGAPEAMASWIEVAAAQLSGVPLLGRLNQLGTWYLAISSARYAHAVRQNPAEAGKLETLQVALENMLAQLHEETKRASLDEERAWQRYFPTPPEPSAQKPSRPNADFDAFMKRIHVLDTRLARIQERCNERIGTGEPMEDLLAELKEIQAEGDALNTPLYEAKTRLAEVYLLGHLGRGSEILALASEARRRLLAGRQPSLGSFEKSFERVIYLQTFSGEATAYMILQDPEGTLRTCENVIRDFETERYRVNNPYRQSAFLSAVAEFYHWAAISAFKLERWDAMLEAVELIKARSAIHSRLLTPPKLTDGAESKGRLAREFEELSAGLAKDPANRELLVRRRQVWDLLSIFSGVASTATELPEFTLAALQGALSEDEALLGYFWLNKEVILTIAVDHARFHAKRIILSPDDLSKFNEFVSFVRELKSASGSGMDKAIAKLGAVLLPSFLRDFIASKRRLILSPHLALHLFPFHAIRWDAQDYIATRFAVRYVPNFSSLLLPWQSHAEDRVLALAIEEFADPKVPPLSKVEGDVDAIQTYYASRGTTVEVMTGKSATRVRLESLRASGELAKFRCIHFGTHGLSVFETPNEPMEAKLLMQDGSLDCMDIAELNLNAELAVLSACHSGQRALAVREFEELPGDDIFGLQSALFQSGVRCVLGTLWLVETDSSSAITRAFHRHYAVTSQIETSLQEAIRDYLAEPLSEKGAFYWAPYFISCLGQAPKLGPTFESGALTQE